MVLHFTPPCNGGTGPVRPDDTLPKVFNPVHAGVAAAEAHPAYLAAERIKNSLGELADSCRLFAAEYGPDAITHHLAGLGLLVPGVLPDDFRYAHAAIVGLPWLLDLLDDAICIENAVPMSDGTVTFPGDRHGRAA